MKQFLHEYTESDILPISMSWKIVAPKRKKKAIKIWCIDIIGALLLQPATHNVAEYIV